MEIKIDEKGFLHIKRAKKWVKQWCPFNYTASFCCDSCPHFGEPHIRTGMKNIDDLLLCSTI
jgi:hypothetical protein